MGVIPFSIRNALLVNLLLAVILIAGVLAWQAMPREMFPVVETDKVRITTLYEGASPEEVERQVTIPIEEAFDGMADIDSLTSTSSEGRSIILIDLKPGTDVDNFVRDADATLDRVTDLPELREKPELTRLQTRFPVISVAVYGDVSRGGLYDVSEQVKRRLMQIPGVAGVGEAGIRDWELWVEVDPEKLAANGIPITRVESALRENLPDLPGGSIKAREGDILLRGLGVAPRPEAVSAIALRTNPGGGQLTLGEVAHVAHRLEEAETLGRFNGKPSVNLTVTKTAEASTIEVADRVYALVDKLRADLPPGVHAGVFSDLSVYVKHRLSTVKSSGLVGLVLVLLSLYLFLNFRVALVTAMGIPVSFLVGIILLHYFGYTINMVSMFAFLIVLGMIVDDAIIVTENVYRYIEQGMAPREAAFKGAREVFWPVVASTATTIAAFLPMFAIGGTMGAFIVVIPVVVICTLLGSLWEAFVVLPSHAAEMLRPPAPVASRAGGRRKRLWHPDWPSWLTHYTAVLRWSVVNRYFVALATVGLLLITLLFAATRLPFQLFGQVDIGQFFVNIEAPNTYSLDDTTQLAGQVETAIHAALRPGELKSMLTNVGVTFIDFNRIRVGSHYVQVIVDLEKQAPKGFIERWITPLVNLRFGQTGSRQRDATTVINAVRAQLQRVPGIQRFSILKPQGGPAGADVEIGVSGPQFRQLDTAARALVDYLRRLPGTHDVKSDLEEGKLEYQYTLNALGRQLGLNQAMLAEAVRAGFQGVEAVYVNWGEKRIPVRVIYPEAVRRQPASLRKLRLALPGGGTVYLEDVADIRVRRGLSTINRRDMQRLVTVTAEVDDARNTPLAVTRAVQERFADFEQRHPGYRLLFLGERKEAAESLSDMVRALVLALVLIFFILAALFKSLLDPLVVMFAIPFGVIGVIVGHALFGYHLQFLSMIGLLALSGIVVNDSLILVEFAKRLRAEGRDRIEAMIEAGRVRIRPILLTTVTTFLGVSPLIFFATGQTAFLSPMAVSLGFGLVFATALILIALPCFYLIADDLRAASARRWNRWRQRQTPQAG